MSTKSPPIEESVENRSEDTATEEVVLRDESDVIIDNLKSQLHNLKRQLDRYQSTGGPPPEGAPPLQAGAAGGDAGLTERIASRLQIPAEELAERLERLIIQINDPELKAELAHCRETAFFLSDTFRRISEKHGQLTESLTAEALELDTEDFRSRLDASLHDRNLPIEISAQGPLPARIKVAPQSVITVLVTLADLAVDLFGSPGKALLSCPHWNAPGDGGTGTIVLRVTCPQALQGMDGAEAVSVAVLRSGIRSRAVVDLLYVEKIIEMRGGVLEFAREEGEVTGFSVSLPITVVDHG